MFLNSKLDRLMFVQVLAGQSANVGVSPELQYGVQPRSFNTDKARQKK